MQDELSPTERRLLGTLRELWQRLGASIVTMGEVSAILSEDAASIEAAARSLETKDLVVCSPASGRVAVIILTRKPDRAHPER